MKVKSFDWTFILPYLTSHDVTSLSIVFRHLNKDIINMTEDILSVRVISKVIHEHISDLLKKKSKYVEIAQYRRILPFFIGINHHTISILLKRAIRSLDDTTELEWVLKDLGTCRILNDSHCTNGFQYFIEYIGSYSTLDDVNRYLYCCKLIVEDKENFLKNEDGFNIFNNLYTRKSINKNICFPIFQYLISCGLKGIDCNNSNKIFNAGSTLYFLVINRPQDGFIILDMFMKYEWFSDSGIICLIDHYLNIISEHLNTIFQSNRSGDRFPMVHNLQSNALHHLHQLIFKLCDENKEIVSRLLYGYFIYIIRISYSYNRSGVLSSHCFPFLKTFLENFGDFFVFDNGSHILYDILEYYPTIDFIEYFINLIGSSEVIQKACEYVCPLRNKNIFQLLVYSNKLEKLKLMIPYLTEEMISNGIVYCFIHSISTIEIFEYLMQLSFERNVNISKIEYDQLPLWYYPFCRLGDKFISQGGIETLFSYYPSLSIVLKTQKLSILHRLCYRYTIGCCSPRQQQQQEQEQEQEGNTYEESDGNDGRRTRRRTMTRRLRRQQEQQEEEKEAIVEQNLTYQQLIYAIQQLLNSEHLFDISLQDEHLNTPLHYLAFYCIPYIDDFCIYGNPYKSLFGGETLFPPETTKSGCICNKTGMLKCYRRWDITSKRVIQNKEELIYYLLDKFGPDILTLQNEDGYNIIMLFVIHGDYYYANLLLEYYYAAKGREATTNILLKQVDQCGNNLLLQTCISAQLHIRNNHIPIQFISTLITNYGIQTNIVNLSGYSFFFEAIRHNSIPNPEFIPELYSLCAGYPSMLSNIYIFELKSKKMKKEKLQEILTSRTNLMYKTNPIIHENRIQMLEDENLFTRKSFFHAFMDSILSADDLLQNNEIVFANLYDTYNFLIYILEQSDEEKEEEDLLSSLLNFKDENESIPIAKILNSYRKPYVNKILSLMVQTCKIDKTNIRQKCLIKIYDKIASASSA